VGRIVDEIFRERFWLRRAERRARSYSDAQRDEIRLLSRAARSRMSAAASLRSPGELGAAFSLLREALSLWVTAICVARGEREPGAVLSVPEAWSRLDGLGEDDAPGQRPAELEPLLSSPSPLAGDALPTEEALRLRPVLEAELARLAALVEVRSVRGIRVRRVLRLTGVIAAVLTLVTASVVWALAPPSSAHGKTPRVKLHR
jgi:hypothetical protein